MDALYTPVSRNSGRTRKLGGSSRACFRGGGPVAGARPRHLGGARGRKHFVYSKVMAWVAFDRAVKAWSKAVSAVLSENGVRFATRSIGRSWRAAMKWSRNTFVQHYDGMGLDASLLLMAEVGFLPPDDPRFFGERSKPLNAN